MSNQTTVRREAEHAIRALVDLLGRERTIAFVADILHGTDEKEFRRIPARRIIRDIAIMYDLKADDLTGPSRRRHIVCARWTAMRLIYQQGRLSSPQIGRLFNKDHTSVLYACGRTKR